jgi:hypothetical protein
MLTLTLDLASSAEVLGTEPDVFLDFVKKRGIQGVIKLKDTWRVSIFTLAQLLNTTPSMLLELLEDNALAQLIEEGEDDESFEGEEGFKVYQSYVAAGQR